jgi:hypothetical protein
MILTAEGVVKVIGVCGSCHSLAVCVATLLYVPQKGCTTKGCQTKAMYVEGNADRCRVSVRMCLVYV